jgi:hypothetical protein
MTNKFSGEKNRKLKKILKYTRPNQLPIYPVTNGGDVERLQGIEFICVPNM